MPKVLYDVDPYNRLILRKTGERAKTRRFRKVVYGRFKTDSKNRLYYEIYKSYGTNIPQKIKFAGKYLLDKKHNLMFTLNRWSSRHKRNKLRLRTKIIDANGSEIVFLLNSRPHKNLRSSYIMKLHGSWQADKNNRLTFGVKREKGRVDNLTLFKAWKIGQNNEIVYSYGQDPKIITLKGSWHIKDRYRLGYILDKGINSGFDFKTSLGRLVPNGRNPYIQFDVVIYISRRKITKRKVIFICRRKLGKSKKIVLEVSSRKRDATLRLTRKILDQKGLAYIESSLKDREIYLGGGLAFRW